MEPHGAMPVQRHGTVGGVGGPTTVELSVQGMHCQSCALLIEETLADDPCVHEVTVDLDSARATVTFEAGDASGETICTIVTNLGYPAVRLAADSPDP